MHFGLALDSSDIELLTIDLFDTHLDLLDADTPSKQFICLQDVFKTFPQSITIFHLPRRLKDVLQDVCWVTLLLLKP